jgi:aryl-alcohol dehydrogenase-like predicted oxidoreductase
MLSIIGFGGIVVTNATMEEAAARVGAAIDGGINYFDVAPSYGNAEQMLGPALAPYRNDVFLACKTGKRDRAGAEAELKQSLQHLQTDHFDLYQLHAMSTAEDVERAFGPGGAMEAFVAARDAGLVRYLGFSAHSAEVALDALSRFPFDSVCSRSTT